MSSTLCYSLKNLKLLSFWSLSRFMPAYVMSSSRLVGVGLGCKIAGPLWFSLYERWWARVRMPYLLDMFNAAISLLCSVSEDVCISISIWLLFRLPSPYICLRVSWFCMSISCWSTSNLMTWWPSYDVGYSELYFLPSSELSIESNAFCMGRLTMRVVPSYMSALRRIVPYEHFTRLLTKRYLISIASLQGQFERHLSSFSRSDKLLSSGIRLLSRTLNWSCAFS